MKVRKEKTISEWIYGRKNVRENERKKTQQKNEYTLG